MHASVIVATRNRVANLEHFLDSIAHWRMPPQCDWEVIVADNGSTDGTAALVQACRERHAQVRYLWEGRPGKSLALNAAIKIARGGILAFTDDDCIPDNEWLAMLCEEFAANAELGLIGGRVELFDPQDRPITIRTSTQRARLASPSELFTLIAGCNMAARATVAAQVGGFDTGMGPGSRMHSAEDIDYIYRIFKAGWQVEYVPSAVTYHNHGRRTDEDVSAVNQRYLRGRGAFYGKYIASRDPQILRMAYWEIRKLTIGLPRKGEARSLRILCGGMLGWFLQRRATEQPAADPARFARDPQ